MTGRSRIGVLGAACLAAALAGRSGRAADAGVTVDAAAKTVSIPCKVAPRKLPNLSEIYPLEVVACYPAPAGQKAHETVVTFDVKPSEVHQALEKLGLKPGTPAKGEGAKPAGPVVEILLEVPGEGGAKQRIPIEKILVDRKTGKALPRLKWHFTGSIRRQPDPAKPETAYAADLTGTLIAIYPVTDETVLQSQLTMREEKLVKLEVDKKLIPAEGTPVVLVLAVK